MFYVQFMAHRRLNGSSNSRRSRDEIKMKHPSTQVSSDLNLGAIGMWPPALPIHWPRLVFCHSMLRAHTDLEYWIQHCSAHNHNGLVIIWLYWVCSFPCQKLSCLNGSRIYRLMQQYKLVFDVIAYAIWISTK